MRSVRLYGFGPDASWNGGRLVAGTDGLREFLLVGDGMLPGDVACHGLLKIDPNSGRKNKEITKYICFVWWRKRY